MLPLNDWFRFANENENYRVWTALKEGKHVGVVMVEIEKKLTANIALLVDPLLRGEGYGKTLIKMTMELPEMSQINKWFAGIEDDNKSCLSCFRSVGYSLEHVQPDYDGYYSLIYLMKS